MAVIYKKWSAYTAAGTLSGSETIACVKAGASVRTTTQEIANTASVLGAYTSGTHEPTADDGAALGSSSKRWSDLFLASGGIINWGSGDVTATHSSGLLTLSGALTVSGAFTAATTLAATGAATLASTLSVAGLATLTSSVIAGVQTLTGAGAVNLTHFVTKLVTTGANALTLADGVEGQLKFIVMTTDAGDGTLTPTNLVGAASTITFDDVGDSVLLCFLGGQWNVVANTGCTVA